MRMNSGKMIFGALVATIFAGSYFASFADEAKPETDAAVERARREVRMLDDIYKTSIVLITTHYVHDDDDLPAGAAFKALFAGVKEKGCRFLLYGRSQEFSGS